MLICYEFHLDPLPSFGFSTTMRCSWDISYKKSYFTKLPWNRNVQNQRTIEKLQKCARSASYLTGVKSVKKTAS